MKKLLILLALTISVTTLHSQGFKKTVKIEKMGNYEIGNYYLYRHSGDSVTMYSFTLRDKQYSSKTFLQIKLGTKEEAISFFENVIETLDNMEKGDRFDLGLPDENTGFYVNELGVKKLGITVGHIDEYGILSKPVAKNMLKDLKKEK